MIIEEISARVTRPIILKLLEAALLCGFSSCNSDDMLSESSTADGKMTLSMNLTMTKTNSDTSSGDGYEVGTTYENYIDVAGDSFRIYFFDQNNCYIARFEPSSFVATEGSDYTTYSVLGQVPTELAQYSDDFKMVVLANWEKYGDDSMTAGETTIDDLCDATWATYAAKTDFNLSATNLIPFYGVHEYTGVSFTPNVATILTEPITLLRAMAKVEVILDTSDTTGTYATDITFSSVKICHYNATGYCAPSGVYSEDDYDHNGVWASDYVSTLHLVNGANDTANSSTTTSRELSLYQEDDGSSTNQETWIAYVPEYDNSSTDYAYIEVMLDYSVGPYKIYFSDYTDGTTTAEDMYDIQRNNLYRFTARVLNGKIIVTVDDWSTTYDHSYYFNASGDDTETGENTGDADNAESGNG